MSPDYLEKQRARRKASGNANTRKYEKTPGGFLMRKYRNMVSRISGIQKAKHHLYSGKELISKDEFYSWAKSAEFYSMYNDWVASSFNRKLTPTVDRIDPNKGYTIGNMEWVTHSENSRRGAVNRNSIFRPSVRPEHL